MSEAHQTDDEMRVDPQRASQLASSLSKVASNIKSANTSARTVRLIAVSKLKPASDVLALHQSPTSQLHFGENYLQELQHKASTLPKSIRWSFIGGLQTNKAAPLGHVPSLWAVNSIDTIKKADALEKGRRQWVESEEGQKMLEENKGVVEEVVRVFVQVNTSGEDSKSGAEPGEEVLKLCRHIKEKTQFLRLQGLMTIGAIARSKASSQGEENEDFVTLRNERDFVVKELGLEKEELELSMGMSADYEEAIQMGSAEVRVGSTIFGQRPPKGEKST